MGTAPSDVPERLKLYEQIRYERGHKIQEFSRQAGKDWVDGKAQIDSKSHRLALFSSLLVSYRG